ncbi:MAG: hypothetical protein IKF18_01805 [Erysipelotrichaceae bacterium]|nr:hypothetical protein [Erysipelotrichaceae bacterium]
MLVSNMTLRQMIDFKPGDEDMALLPLDVTVYIKATIISKEREDNVGFIRHLFTHDLVGEVFKDPGKTVFYDFDAREVKNSHKFITIFELYSKEQLQLTAEDALEILQGYHGDADVIFDLFSFDNRMIRLSILDGILNSEEIKEA